LKAVARLIKGKKAISPFISIILIVALAVIVAGIVINWTTTFTKETQERTGQEITQTTDCAVSAGLGVWRDIDGKEQICLDTATKELVFVLENKESMKIENVNINVLLQNSAISNQTGISIPPGAIAVGKIRTNSSSASEIKSVIFVPALKKGDKIYWCGDNKITVQGVSVGSC